MRRSLYILTTAWAVATAATAPAAPTNAILFIGDGMGFEQVKAARMYYGPLVFETLPYTAQLTHNNASDGTTDSAASSTAMATGHKVNNGVISVQTPGDGSELTTVLEILSAQGKRTGLVTTHTVITDATPAGFGAHAPNRSQKANIGDDYLTQTRPNVLFGLTQADLVANAPAAGYTVVTTAADFAALDTAAGTNYAGLFTSAEQPTTAEMTTMALDILDNDPDGFFLLVENEETDTSGHDHQLQGVVDAILDLDDAVMAALNWATANDVLSNTLILVTADHETGGLTVLTNNGMGVLPAHTFSTSGHTQTPVPVYATGSTADAARVSGTIDNTDIFYILNGTERTEPESIPPTLVFQQGVDGYTGTVDTFIHEDNSNSVYATSTSLLVDDDDPPGSDQDIESLLRFEDIFGSAPERIPLDVPIFQATLQLYVSNPGDAMRLHRMLQPWSDGDNWNDYQGGTEEGIDRDNIEATVGYTDTGAVSTETFVIDVTSALQAWQADPSGNWGWVFKPTLDNGVDFDSAEGSTPPTLVISLKPPSNPATVMTISRHQRAAMRRHGRRHPG